MIFKKLQDIVARGFSNLLDVSYLIFFFFAVHPIPDQGVERPYRHQPVDPSVDGGLQGETPNQMCCRLFISILH